VECPDCHQDYLELFSVSRTGESGVVCPECDALWIAGENLPPPGHTRRGIYSAERGLGPGEFLLGPSTGDGPLPPDVRVLRRLPFRPRKLAPNEPPWGEVGGILCPYCNGNLLNAEIPPGVRFSFCDVCESLWPDGVPLDPIAPTCLADYLDLNNATWDEVSNLGRRREA